MIQPPILVDAKSELLIFRSADAAAGWLEAIDVQNGEYAAAYDSEGRRLELDINTREDRSLFGLLRTKIDLVGVRVREEEANHSLDLIRLLRTHLPGEAPTESSAGSLKALVEAAVDRLGYTA